MFLKSITGLQVAVAVENMLPFFETTNIGELYLVSVNGSTTLALNCSCTISSIISFSL